MFVAVTTTTPGLAESAESASAEPQSFTEIYLSVAGGSSETTDSEAQDLQQSLIATRGGDAYAVMALSTPFQRQGLKPFSIHGEAALPTSAKIWLGAGNESYPGQCVGWVRYQTGWDVSGNAITWKKYINSEEPEINSVVVLNMSAWGHIGIVVSIDEEKREFTYRSRNELGLWVISDTTMPIDDARILGFIVADPF